MIAGEEINCARSVQLHRGDPIPPAMNQYRLSGQVVAYRSLGSMREVSQSPLLLYYHVVSGVKPGRCTPSSTNQSQALLGGVRRITKLSQNGWCHACHGQALGAPSSLHTKGPKLPQMFQPKMMARGGGMDGMLSSFHVLADQQLLKNEERERGGAKVLFCSAPQRSHAEGRRWETRCANTTSPPPPKNELALDAHHWAVVLEMVPTARVLILTQH